MAKKPQPTPSERLMERLRLLLAEKGLVVRKEARLVSLHPSPNQRAQGAWSWQMLPSPIRYGDVGSQHSMGKLLVAVRLEVSQSDSKDWHVDPIFAGGRS